MQSRWRDAFGTEAPARLGEAFLRRTIAYHIQEQALGGLNRQAQLRLKALEQRAASTSTNAGSSSLASSVSPCVKAGTRFVREWQNEVHEVQAVDSGEFVYRGRMYRSLSVIARAITGTHQSGPKFFGLKEEAKKPKQMGGRNG